MRRRPSLWWLSALLVLATCLDVPPAGAQQSGDRPRVQDLWRDYPLGGRDAAAPARPRRGEEAARPRRTPPDDSQPATAEPSPRPAGHGDPSPGRTLVLLVLGLAGAACVLTLARAALAGALRRPSARAGPRVGGAIAALAAVALASTAAARAFEATDLPLPLSVAAGVAGVAMLIVAIVRLDLAVAIGFLLMAVVEIEPAPPDAAFAVIIAVATVTGRFRPSRVPRAVVALMGLLAVLNVASMLGAVDLFVGLRFSAITIYLAIFGTWLAGWLDAPAKARMIVRTWLFVAVLSALAGIAVVYFPFPGREILMDGTQTRANVLFQDANVYGPFLVPIAVILLEERLRPRLLRLGRTANALLFLILVFGTIVSFSRAGWVNFVIAVLVMLGVVALRRRGARAATRLLMTLLLVAVAATAVLGATGSLDFFGERAQVQSYDTERFGAQRAGLQMAVDHPLGVGPGQFRFHHELETHSTYVRVLAEQGVLGLLAWLGLAGFTLWLAARNALEGRDTFGIGSAALLGSWCGLLVNSIVVDTLHWRHLWVVAALIWAAAIRDRRPAETPRRRPRSRPAATSAGSSRRPRRSPARAAVP